MIKVYITDFQHLLPPVMGEQDILNDYILRSHQRSAEIHGVEEDWERLKKYLVSPEYIERRGSFCRDLHKSWEESSVYRFTPETPEGATIFERTKLFQQEALQCFESLYPRSKSLPDHLIHVTCSGYHSPSAPQRYFASEDKTPAITHAYHMGCYAALPAVRMARSFVGAGEFEKVDVVHTELCSLHMTPSVHTPEQIIVQSLFADGVIRYELSSDLPENGFEILLLKEKLVPDSSEDMTWVPSPHGMVMSLAREVPTKIALGLNAFVEEVCQEMGMDWEELKSQSLFAIHPGGPKILDLASELLEANDDQMRASYKILRRHGNMSSATLPHIWEEMLKEKTEKPFVLSLAFGPGLTIIGSIMRRIQP
jgi:predicted naringenin-chalcone synthase